eukprot:1538071-Lingulodinium_polyedra.AAC.1
MPRSTAAASAGSRSGGPQGSSKERAGRGPGRARLMRATLQVERGGPATIAATWSRPTSFFQ